MQYLVISPIKHNGVHIQPGQKIDLSEEEAKMLAESGCIEYFDKPFVGEVITPWGAKL